MNYLKKEVREIADGTIALSNGEIVGFNSSLNRELLFAVTRNSLNYRDESGMFAKTQTAEGQVYDIYLSVDGELAFMTTIEDNFNFHDLQLLFTEVRE